MKKSLIAAVVLASASFASTAAMAATVGNTPQVLDLTDGSGFFGDTFAMNNNGNTFADRFTFNVGDTSAGSSLDAIISSVSHSADTGLDITGVSLYNATGDMLVSSGHSLQSGSIDVWTVSTNNLAAGNYYLQVSGNLVSDQAASFGGAVAMAAPVPEPETYGMMLAGLGVLGFLARRRKSANQA
jgi:hypothetical protein